MSNLTSVIKFIQDVMRDPVALVETIAGHQEVE